MNCNCPAKVTIDHHRADNTITYMGKSVQVIRGCVLDAADTPDILIPTQIVNTDINVARESLINSCFQMC